MATLAFDVRAMPGDQGLGLEVRFDHKVIANIVPSDSNTTVTHEFDDSEDGTHLLQITLKNKLPTHTVLDADSNIVSDAVLELTQFSVESIDITQVLCDRACYTHDFNGTAAMIDDVFFGTMGCNGTVSLEITSPVYVWLLEAM
jgi:hypothetical protein